MIYFLADGSNIKIGFTDRPIVERIQELQTGNPQRLQLLASIPKGTRSTEAAIHRNWERDRIRGGEWFNDSPGMRRRIQDLCDQWNF